tara:strand:+ start:42267 stop:43010 length:744 start_codon:yes stop_codon:yes gene_type:complete
MIKKDLLIKKIFAKVYFTISIVAFIMFITGCSETKSVEIVNLTKPKRNQKWEHVVTSGETLYMIAWRHGLDHKKIAMVNNLFSPYKLYNGMKLNLNYSDDNKIVQKSIQKNNVKKNLTKQNVRSVKWAFPIKTNNISKHKKIYKLSKYNKGLDILIPKGQDILAALSGKVVYAGSGLKGYGKLIIIKHEGDYLSAYAYNNLLLVKEGQDVLIGEKIAKSGLRNDGLAMLHFQIRYQGKPVNPIKFIL